MAIIIFADYGKRGSRFTKDARLVRAAASFASAAQQTLGHPVPDYVFLGRIGAPFPRLPLARSVRHSLSWLLVSTTPPLTGGVQDSILTSKKHAPPLDVSRPRP
jgi:hypothetical protein